MSPALLVRAMCKLPMAVRTSRSVVFEITGVRTIKENVVVVVVVVALATTRSHSRNGDTAVGFVVIRFDRVLLSGDSIRHVDRKNISPLSTAVDIVNMNSPAEATELEELAALTRAAADYSQASRSSCR